MKSRNFLCYGTQKSSMLILRNVQVVAMKAAVAAALALCQRNTARLNPQESTMIWFRLLDRYTIIFSYSWSGQDSRFMLMLRNLTLFLRLAALWNHLRVHQNLRIPSQAKTQVQILIETLKIMNQVIQEEECRKLSES